MVHGQVPTGTDTFGRIGDMRQMKVMADAYYFRGLDSLPSVFTITHAPPAFDLYSSRTDPFSSLPPNTGDPIHRVFVSKIWGN